MTELKVVETRKLASFRTVDDIQPIEGADAIELAIVGGWKVVTKKGEFQPGDTCIYFEIDSFLPELDGKQPWQFLVDKQSRTLNGFVGHRLRTIKLRGQISQGLILPVNAFQATRYLMCLDGESMAVNSIGLDDETLKIAVDLRHRMDVDNVDPSELNLNELLKVVKWDPPLPAQLQGRAEGLFPSWIRKTDQERAQNLKEEIFGYEDRYVQFDTSGLSDEAVTAMTEKGLLFVLDDQLMKLLPAKGDINARYEVTMKLDGSSATFFHRDGKVGVCSRNLELKVDDENKDNSFVRMLIDSGLNFILPELGNVVIQGELMGPGIQGNRENLKDFVLYIFDVQLLDEGRYLTAAERYDFCRKLIDFGINPKKVKHAPVMVSPAVFVSELVDLPKDDEWSINLSPMTMDELLKFAEGPSIAHAVREGLVYKHIDGGFSFKTISNKFLDKEKD